MAWPEKEKKNSILVWVIDNNWPLDDRKRLWYIQVTRRQGRSNMSAGNEGKSPSPVESQFYDFSG